MKSVSYIRHIILLLALFCIGAVCAQTTRVRGRVTDAKTGEPIPFVSVFFPNTTIGITTDDNGVYDIETRDTSTMVHATLMGYLPQKKRVRRYVFNTIDFALEEEQIGIEDVVVKPGPNPALALLRGVRRRRAQNDPARFDRYKCKTYTKMELDLANIKQRFRSKRMQKNFGFVFNYVDTSSLTGQPYLPVMISETMADYYHSNDPALSREVIIASQVSGVEDSFSIAQFTGNLQNPINFYDNFIEMFNVRFASPLAEGGTMYYNYFLVDSVLFDNRKTYKIRFHPKRLTTPVLDGEVYIDSASYALRSASVRMPKGVNVNWIKHMRIENENLMLNDSTWFKKRDHIAAEFSLFMGDSSKLETVIGQRDVSYSQVELDCPIPKKIFNMDNDVVIADQEACKQDSTFWSKIRPYKLSAKEKNIYTMVDSIQQAPLYRNIYTIINTILTGYWNTKYIGIGPYYKMASFNKLEGFRMQLGARTTSSVSRKFRLTGYAAYGTRDEDMKGGGMIELMFRRGLTRKLTLEASHDVVQLGAGRNSLTNNNILSSIFSRGGRQRMSMVNSFEAAYEHEWIHGLSTFLGLKLRRIYANRYVPMITPEGRLRSFISDSELHVGLRFSHNEKIYRTHFDKNFLGTKYPIITLDVNTGLKQLVRGGSEYCRVEGGIQYSPKIPPIGHSVITIQGGKIFGRVPYQLLKLHEGNGTYFYDAHAFSCMNFYEFASDAWVAFFYEHHFNGWLLGRIPLMKRLKWREILICKGVWGQLSRRNDGARPGTDAPLLFPAGMTSVNKPYVEMGVGIENILRLVRVDCIWRLTHRNDRAGQKVQNFSVNVSLNLTF